MDKTRKMPEKTGRKCQERGKTRPKLDKNGTGRYILIVRIGFHQHLSSLCERELSQPISREAVTEGSVELRNA